MKYNFILAGALLIASAGTGYVSAQDLNNPVTKAMMEVYNQELDTNSKNYEIYFRRANEYYKFNQYLRALSDIDNAIKYAPSTDKDLLFQAYSLRGDIYQMLGKHQEALADFTEALRLDPTSFMALYQKANSEYELGMYAEAKTDYNRMRAINGRSAEALTGLARVAVKENNLGLASEYMDDAVAMMPADSDIYVRRNSVRRMLGNNTGAVDDLLMAISIDNNSKAFQELINISNEDYPAVIAGLSNAIHQAPEQGMFYYIRAMIAQAHYHYPSAIADYRKIIEENMYNYAGIYGALAECYFNLCKYDEASENINQAIGMTSDNGAFFLTLSKIQLAKGLPEAAMKSVQTALLSDPSNADMLVQKGVVQYALGQFDDAATLFGELMMDHPETAVNYLFRAWVVADGLKQKQNAVSIYKRLLEVEDESQSVMSMRGFALLFTGDKDGALAWMDKILHGRRDTDGSLNYYAACLYAQAGEDSRALDAMERSLNLGYANLYNWTAVDVAEVNVQPIRSNSLFNQLLANYSYIFE